MPTAIRLRQNAGLTYNLYYDAENRLNMVYYGPV